MALEQSGAPGAYIARKKRDLSRIESREENDTEDDHLGEQLTKQ